MNTYDEIIQYLISMQLVEKLSNKYLHYLKQDKSDFIQEMYLIILSVPKDKIIALFSKNELIRYIMQIVKNQLFNKHSKFSVKYDRFITKIAIPENDKD